MITCFDPYIYLDIYYYLSYGDCSFCPNDHNKCLLIQEIYEVTCAEVSLFSLNNNVMVLKGSCAFLKHSCCTTSCIFPPSQRLCSDLFVCIQMMQRMYSGNSKKGEKRMWQGKRKY